MPLRFTVSAIGPRYASLLQRKADQIQASAVAAMEQTRDEILARGRADIAGAGSFGRRWTDGLQGEVTEAPGEIDLKITHNVEYFMVFQRGAMIRGKPLLAIPLSFAGVPKGTYARNFPGGLFRVNRKSGAAPLLLSRADKQPKYFLRESVTIPKKFRVLEIIAEESKNLRARFLALLRKA